MADQRTEEQIDKKAYHLFSIHRFGPGTSPKTVEEAWLQETMKAREGWRRLARAVRGVVHHEDAETGGWPTENQAVTIRKLREKCLKEGGRERSWIGETRPYGEMVLVFEHPKESPSGSRQIKWVLRGWIVHPDGEAEELHKERISSP